MKKFAIILPLLILLSCCTIIKYVPVESETVVSKVDSIVWHDSIIYYYIPVEKVIDITPQYDTLDMETSMAKARAYVDTLTHTLKGNMENKKDSLAGRIKWKERIVYKDSIITKNVPIKVPVEKIHIPNWVWWSLGFNIITILLFVLKLYIKFIK